MKSIKLKITSGFSSEESKQSTILTSESNYSENHVRQEALKKSMIRLLVEIAGVNKIEWLDSRIQDFLNNQQEDSFIFFQDESRCLTCYLS